MISLGFVALEGETTSIERSFDRFLLLENFRNAPKRIIQSHTWGVELGRFE